MCCKDHNIIDKIAYILLIIGGLNWGLIGIFNGNIVTAIFGQFLGRLIFIVVGVAAGYLVYRMFMLWRNAKDEKTEEPKMTMKKAPKKEEPKV